MSTYSPEGGGDLDARPQAPNPEYHRREFRGNTAEIQYTSGTIGLGTPRQNFEEISLGVPADEQGHQGVVDGDDAEAGYQLVYSQAEGTKHYSNLYILIRNHLHTFSPGFSS